MAVHLNVKTLGQNEKQNTGSDILKLQTTMEFKIFINHHSYSTTMFEGYFQRTFSILSEHLPTATL